MNTIKKYDIPTQVMFYDYCEDEFAWGIAYGEIIICACCGGTFNIDEVIAEAYDYRGLSADKAIINHKWVDFTDEIAF